MIRPNGNVIETSPGSHEARLATQLRAHAEMVADPETALMLKASASVITGMSDVISRAFDAGRNEGYTLRQREIDMQDEHIRNLEALYRFNQTAKCKNLLDHYLATKSAKFKSAVADELVGILDEYRHGNY